MQDYSLDEIYEMYKTDADLKHYIDAYCNKHGINTFEALAHITPQEVAKYYKDKVRDIIKPAGNRQEEQTK